MVFVMAILTDGNRDSLRNKFYLIEKKFLRINKIKLKKKIFLGKNDDDGG